MSCVRRPVIESSSLAEKSEWQSLTEEDSLSLDASVVHWLDQLKEGQEQAVEVVWQRYFKRVADLAEDRLPGYARSMFDGEDVALSAIHSLCRGVSEGRFEELSSVNHLWAILVVITRRKLGKRLRSITAEKRDARRTLSAHLPPDPTSQNDEYRSIDLIGREPTPEFVASVAEETAHLMQRLPDDDCRSIVQLRLEGLTIEEIADRVSCGTRTVHRRLDLVRRVWSDYFDELQTN